jgi:hypothetical protein
MRRERMRRSGGGLSKKQPKKCFGNEKRRISKGFEEDHSRCGCKCKIPFQMYLDR